MVGLMLLIFELSCCFSGAYGTSTFLLSGSGVDGRFPNMPFSAFPPYPLVTSRRYHFWSQTAVQRAIPLRGDFRMKRSKIIETGQNAPARTIWAGGAFHSSGCNYCLPFMSKRTSPPDLFVAVRRYVIRSQAAVAFSIPLHSEIRKEGGQVILARHGSFPATNWTPSTSVPAQDTRTLRMSILTFPPDIFSASGQYFGGLQFAVLFHIPLCSQRRIYRGKVVSANPQNTPCAVWAF